MKNALKISVLLSVMFLFACSSSSKKVVVPECTSVAYQDQMTARSVYRQGLEYYHNGEYENAKETWIKGRRIDPCNNDFTAGLEKLKKENLIK